jgi:serine O-acetyltransferase
VARGSEATTRALSTRIRARHSPFIRAVLEDARVSAQFRGERHEFRSRADALAQALRLTWVSDAFCAQVLYRAKARLQALGVPILPRVAHRLAVALAQVCIDDSVVVEPGVYIAHGQIVVDGSVDIGAGVVLFPWVTIGRRDGDPRGPTIARGVRVGTGAQIVGPVMIGAEARIGANAVVVTDVAPDTTVVGAPARPVTAR